MKEKVKLDPSCKVSWVDTHGLLWNKKGEWTLVYANAYLLVQQEFVVRSKSGVNDYRVVALNEIEWK